MKEPTARAFADLLLQLVRGGGLPMVFFKVTVPIIGGRAKMRAKPARIAEGGQHRLRHQAE